MISDAAVTRRRHRALEYVASPDMVAFTIGQITLAALREKGTLSAENLRDHLVRIATGIDEALATRVSPDMALGALGYIDTLVTE